MMLPHRVITGFLGEAAAAGLLAHAIEREAAFLPTTLGPAAKGRVDPAVRMSVGTRDLGRHRSIIETGLAARLVDLAVAVGAAPVDRPRFELELTAHNDGAFYRRHIDTRTGADRRRIRVISGVYYVHRRPKAFSGGALRLYAVGDPTFATFQDVEPAHDALVVFPSWAPHEVMPVRCPSGRFEDSRFAVNCWVWRPSSADEAAGEGARISSGSGPA